MSLQFQRFGGDRTPRCPAVPKPLDAVATVSNPLMPMSTSIKDPVLDRVKPSFVIFDIRALGRSALNGRVPGCQKLQMTA